MLSNSPLFTTLQTIDLGRAKKFYKDTLDLKVIEENEDHGIVTFEAGKGTRLQFFLSDTPAGEDTVATFEVTDLEAEMTNLKSKGVKFEDYDLEDIKTVAGVATMGNEKAAWFKDPDGHILCMHERIK